MAICNLFKQLNKTTGEFLMFSQWVEDLTQNHAKGYKYRAVPSRFIAAHIDFDNLLDSVYNKGNSDLNDALPRYLQNYFENGCAVGKNELSWNPELSSNLFWYTMEQAGLIHINKTNEVSEFKYIGDINIQSYDEKNGMGYNEMYCYIPNNAQEQKITCTKTQEELSIVNENVTVEGYNVDDPIVLKNDVNDIIYNYGIKYDFDYKNYVNVDTSEKYDINCIIILYDIKSYDSGGSNSILYSNIPLGLYVPGCFDGKHMTNTITKWVYNNDIYNSGTSYGIRICTRFTVSPNTNFSISSDIEQVNSDEYTAISNIMSGISDNLKSMESIATTSEFNLTKLKNTINQLQNFKTNVPYILEVNGVKYWFVNGKNTNCTINGEDPNKQLSCSDEDIFQLVHTMIDNVTVHADFYPYDSDNDSKRFYLKKYADDEQDTLKAVEFKFDFNNKYTGTYLIPQSIICIYPNGYTENVEYNMENRTFVINNIKEDGRYALHIDYNGKLYKCDYNFKFYYPSYFGFVDEDVMNKYLYDKNIEPVKDLLLECKTPSPFNRFKFNSNGQYIVYMFPQDFETKESSINKVIFNGYDNIFQDFKKIDNINIQIPYKDDNKTKNVAYSLYYTINPTSTDTSVILDFTNTDNIIDTCQVI